MQKALEQDSTVYDYDAVYDEIQNQRLENSKKVLQGTDKRVIQFFHNSFFLLSSPSVVTVLLCNNNKNSYLFMHLCKICLPVFDVASDITRDRSIALVCNSFFTFLFFFQPRYIHQLMKAMEDRKKEQERREDRKIQKEREAEGEQFADKEAYVTSAYKKKLQEQKEEEEREKREAALEG